MDTSPTMLVVDALAGRPAFVRAHLAPLGWAVEPGDTTGARGSGPAPALVLLDPALPDAAGIARRLGAAGGGPPILAFAGEEEMPADLVPVIDGTVAWPCTAAALVAAIRPWQPVEMTLDRLAAMFGADRLAGLLADFRTQLETALGRLDEGDPGLAHRIGGLAGTLGFARVSAAWLAVSEGDASALPAARASARAAGAAIDRWPAHGARTDAGATGGDVRP